ncbi:hypothetical protein ACFX13_029016 [Malus domestica]
MIAKRPLVLHYSLEKRLVPRCSVAKVLLLKGLIKGIENVNLSSLLEPVEKCFLERSKELKSRMYDGGSIVDAALFISIGLYECVREETKDNTGIFSEKDGMAVGNDCQITSGHVLEFVRRYMGTD